MFVVTEQKYSYNVDFDAKSLDAKELSQKKITLNRGTHTFSEVVRLTDNMK